jgi:hypothetical protein
VYGNAAASATHIYHCRLGAYDFFFRTQAFYMCHALALSMWLLAAGVNSKFDIVHTYLFVRLVYIQQMHVIR